MTVQNVSMDDLKSRVSLFVDKLQALYDASYTHPGLPAPLVSLEWGNKNVKVVLTDRRQDRDTGEVAIAIDPVTKRPIYRSVYCFIDIATGNLLKAAGWKAPAKGARGNIFNDNCDVGTRATLHGSGLYIR